ncbi:MAG: response regulator [Myxococcota bacterium]|nr:response regulator [Myxococcota bacterium]
MSESSSTTDLTQEIEETRTRLSSLLSGEAPRALEGVEEITRGLDKLLEQLGTTQIEDEATSTQLEVLLQGLKAVADFFVPRTLEEPAKPAPTGQTSSVAEGLKQFISAFQNEAQKRLSGLSLSMMGLFNHQGSNQALDKSAQHLHAIRGGAAMLGLKELADISGLMEQVLVTMRKLPPEERIWPTKPLMNGYRLLETAIHSSDVHVDAQEAAQVLSSLQECFDDLLSHTTLEELSRPLEEETQAETPSAKEKDKTRPPEVPTQHTPSAPPKARRKQPKQRKAPVSLEHTTSLDGMEQRILIVDDVDTIAASIGFVLGELDLPLDIAGNGEEALRMLRERPYSLIISDIAMPRLDGIALTRMIRDDDYLSDIPVILLTSLDHPNERDAGFDAGANDYIIKGSIGGGELVHRVRELLKIAPFVPTEAVHRASRKRIIVAEDTETVAASIAFVLSEGDYDIVLASNGHEALTKLERERFDLLISDWQMPSMSGYELTRAVRASAHIAQIPIVLLTSLDSDKVRQDAFDAGANRFLVKGEIGGGLLLEVVEELIDKD